MKTITVTEARKNFDRLLEEATSTGEPIRLTARPLSAVLISEDAWRSIQETLDLLSIPGLRESLEEGRETSLEECLEEPGW